MEVYMHGIPRPATESEIIILLAEALHSPSFNHLIPLGVAVPLNFSIAIPRRQKNPNSRYGFLKIPVPAIGQALIRQSLIGSRVRIRNRQIHFKPGNRQMAPEDVRDLSTSPYIEPKHAQEWEERQAKLSGSMSVRVVQFGWRCRDDVFSPEWEPSFASWDLTFQDDRRQIVVSGTVIHDLDDLNFGSLMRPVGKRYLIVLKYSNIASIEAAENHETPSLLFTLNVPPTFETQDILPDLEDGADDDRVIKRQRVSHFDEQHSRVAPFTSNTLRLICRSVSGLQDFKTKCAVAGVRRLRLSGFLVEKRDLFSASSLNWLKTWYRTLDWSVAFQCISLLNDLVLDPTELRSLKRKIEHLSLLGTSRAREVLRLMGLYLYALLFPDDLEESSPQTVDECFSQADKSVTKSYMAAQPQIGKDLFACRHITFTPTMTILEGPTPEQSNRVFRWYPDHQEYFVRVNFTDEDKMQFRFEREVDGPAFVQQRVGTVLHEGFELAGRHFKFLGYSSSSLKEHSVWFCALFELPGRGLITRQVIVDQVGDFERVIHCPARFGARLSQAFSATDPSIALTAEEVHTIDDISRSGSEFTDGIGTMSKEVADGIWEALGTLRGGKRQRRLRYSPSAYQIRMGGYKGMISVDYELEGHIVCVRPSMDKFDGRNSRDIEIANVLDRPLRMYLNRPLIAILETLGVPADEFVRLQRMAIEATRNAAVSISASAELLETHGLGASFRLPGILKYLAKNTESSFDMLGSSLASQSMGFAVVHILRDLMHRARIPVGGSCTLVGIADIHGYLKECEIFACIRNRNDKPFYLEGPILVSRSPTMHPGDVQMVHAIGTPPRGSPFQNEEFPNCIVFSTHGDRSLPSCLGGGDLDGDLYNLITMPALHPKHCASPASYEPAMKRIVDHSCTLEDVANFVVDFINSDILGMIANKHLILSDLSSHGVEDPNCVLLSKLHSDAVDFPKSGTPVPISSLPKVKIEKKPDWDAGEMSTDSARYYTSQKALGILYREVKMADEEERGEDILKTRTRYVDRTIFEELLVSSTARERRLRNIVSNTLKPVLRQHIDIEYSHDETALARAQFLAFEAELRHISTHCTLSFRHKPLKEAEIFVGTIFAKTSQHRVRKKLTTELRKATTDLVDRNRRELLGDDKDDIASLSASWIAWEVAVSMGDIFGAESFGWIALGAIVEALKSLDDGF